MRPPSRRERIAAQLADLKIPGALEALDGVLAGVDGGGTTPAEAIERLLAAQIELRNGRRLEAAMRSSRLPYVKTLAAFDFAFQPSIKREQIDALHELGFVERRGRQDALGHQPGDRRGGERAQNLLRDPDRPGELPGGGQGGGPARTPPQDADPPGPTGRRRDRLPAGDPERRGPVLPAHQPAL